MLLQLIIILAQLQNPVGFEVALWPGEGRPVFEVVGKRLLIHELPSPGSDAVAVGVRPGRRLEFDDTLYRTVKPGRIRAVASAVLRGRRFGDVRRLTRSDYYTGTFPRQEVPIAAGQGFEFLQYRAEGTCFVRIAGVVFEADECPTDNRLFHLDDEPVTEWWIHVSIEEHSGWLCVGENTVEVVDRTF